jgi:hypothetical protein
MPTNVFILALHDFQRRELESLPNADRYAFHGLLDYDTLVLADEVRFGDLLERARAELAAFPGSVDAIVAHWDFPTSVLAPLLNDEHGLPSPSLESVLRCEHKYWSRLEQARSVPECVPAFHTFDPFDDDALDHIELPYPFWVKPVKSFASQLGFRIEDEEAFRDALDEIRSEIGKVGDPFDEVLEMAELPDEVAAATGSTCIAEQIISGVQGAAEGTVFQGEFGVHGLLDMHKDAETNSFQRLDYPSQLPDEVQQRMVELTRRFMEHIGFDNGCFNSEFMWDRDDDQLWLIEVNTRISQSHSDLFAKVDGSSNHEVAIDIALGHRPSMPHRQGRFAVATKGIIPHYEDGVVTRVPSPEEIARLGERYPGTVVELSVSPGDRLAELPNQDSYRYDLGDLYLGADSTAQLVERYRACIDELVFEIAPVDVGQRPAPA